ncbi:hypothetical protein EMIT048CA2_220043 [Pseudomonas chlororaphis]
MVRSENCGSLSHFVKVFEGWVGTNYFKTPSVLIGERLRVEHPATAVSRCPVPRAGAFIFQRFM